MTDSIDPRMVTVTFDRDEALSDCYQAEYHHLVELARLLVDRRGEAEEVVQEAFVRVYADWRRVRNQEDPLFYVRRTVVNLARGGLRRRLTERRHANSGRAADADARSAESVVVDGVRDQALWAGISRLTRRQREAVVLRYFEELSTAETATAMGCSEGSVKAHLHRALVTLKTTLEEQ